MVSVSSAELQQTVAKWLDKARDEPVAITRDDQTAAFLISAALFEDLLSGYRKTISIEQLSNGEMAQLLQAEVETSAPYDLDDLPDADFPAGSGRSWLRIPDKPPVGHVIAYEYLWSSQAGVREDGVKVYPCAVVMSAETVAGGSMAYVLGISHSPPRAGEHALPVPTKLKRHLGLDEEPAWIYTDQLNVFMWPGPDLRQGSHVSSRPAARNTCDIGARSPPTGLPR